MILNIDFPETILDIALAGILEDMQGVSFLSLLTDQRKETWRDAMYYHYYESREDSPLPVQNHYGIRTGRYKLIRFYDDEKDHWELFDLKKDPLELHNVYEDEAYLKVKEELTQMLIQQRNKYGDNTGVPL
jgi:arylsulfatase A-like enzyme